VKESEKVEMQRINKLSQVREILQKMTSFSKSTKFAKKGQIDERRLKYEELFYNVVIMFV